MSAGVSSMVFKVLFWAAIVIVAASQMMNNFLPPTAARWALAINSSVSFTLILGVSSK